MEDNTTELSPKTPYFEPKDGSGDYVVPPMKPRKSLEPEWKMEQDITQRSLKFPAERKQKSKFTVTKIPGASELKKPNSFLPLPRTPFRPASSIPKFEAINKEIKRRAIELVPGLKIIAEGGTTPAHVFRIPTAIKRFRPIKPITLHDMSPGRNKVSLKLDQKVQDTSESLLDHHREKMGENEDSYAKVVIYKTFYHMAVKAWRRRKNLVDQLEMELHGARKSNKNLKNQIHVVNSLYAVEQKHYEEAKTTIKDIESKLDHALSAIVSKSTENAFLSREIEERNKDLQDLQQTTQRMTNEMKTLASNLSLHEFCVQEELASKEFTLGEIHKLQKKIDHLSRKTKQQEFELKDMNTQLEAKNLMLDEYLLLKCEHDIVSRKELMQRKENEKILQEMQEFQNDANLYRASYSYKMKEIFKLVPKQPSYYLRLFLKCLFLGSTSSFKVSHLNQQKKDVDTKKENNLKKPDNLVKICM